MSETQIIPLPPESDFETIEILKELISAHRFLAEMKGMAKTIPNENLLISTLSLQEAQSSSEIENIITTQDELYRYKLQGDDSDPVTKEVAFYAKALDVGYEYVNQQQLLTINVIKQIQQVLEGNDAGFRKTPGTVLKNKNTGEVVYTPPTPELIDKYMSELESFANEPQTIDPLICMALIHHQFESIHPFYDGNGRTGRIMNILYLVKEGLLDSPVLYLSRYINHNKDEYYLRLQAVRDNQDWQGWVVFILKGIAQVAQHTKNTIEEIGKLLQSIKIQIRDNHKFYSQDLINNLFHYPYTKVAFVSRDLDVSRATATRYLDALAKDGLLEKRRMGRESYYVNHQLVELLNF